MQYVKSIVALDGQDVTKLVLHSGQPVKLGFNGKETQKGFFMGHIKSTDEHVFVWDVGQPRPSLHNEMRLASKYIKASNKVKASILKKLFS